MATHNIAAQIRAESWADSLPVLHQSIYTLTRGWRNKLVSEKMVGFAGIPIKARLATVVNQLPPRGVLVRGLRVGVGRPSVVLLCPIRGVLQAVTTTTVVKSVKTVLSDRAVIYPGE